MKTLKLTVLSEPTLSRADLANLFGSFEEINLQNNYIQFTFPSVTILSFFHIQSIHKLLQDYEKENGRLKFKMFHVLDNETKWYSPYSFQCLNGLWESVSSAGKTVKQAPSLAGLM